MRNKIEEKLKNLVDLPVYYGLAPEIREHSDMNFIVFGQQSFSKGENGGDLHCTYYVILVRENFIEDELVFRVIDALEDIPGLRLTKDNMRYDYIQKGSTDFMAETLMLTFSKTKKRY